MNKCVNIPTQSFWFKATSAMLKAVSAFGITLGEITAPPTPSANTGALYTKVDKKLYFKNDAGTETELTNTSGGAASPALDNLAAVAVNTDIISDTDSTDSLGSAAIKWLNIFVDNIGATATRVTKGWFTDLEVTNAITGSVTGNAATVTTNANLTGDVTSAGNATTIAAGAVDVAMLANGTDGELITWDAAAAPTTVPAGTAAQVLTSNGAGAAPTFQAAAGGGETTAWFSAMNFDLIDGDISITEDARSAILTFADNVVGVAHTGGIRVPAGSTGIASASVFTKNTSGNVFIDYDFKRFRPDSIINDGGGGGVATAISGTSESQTVVVPSSKFNAITLQDNDILSMRIIRDATQAGDTTGIFKITGILVTFN